MTRESIFLEWCLLWMVLNGIGKVHLNQADARSNITDGITYPDIVFQSSPELNVTGKKKSKL